MKEKKELIVRRLGTCDYETIWEKMRNFTLNRDQHTIDECWLLEHFPVFTQGQNGKEENIIHLHDIPLVKTDRGGQITYHGFGQLILYPLLDLKRLQLSVHKLVSTLENIILNVLESFQLHSFADPCARGVYIKKNETIQKIASIGLRIKRGCSYHGLALNHDLDLSPFQYIHPCGLKNMSVTSLKEQGIQVDTEHLQLKLASLLQDALGYTNIIWKNSL